MTTQTTTTESPKVEYKFKLSISGFGTTTETEWNGKSVGSGKSKATRLMKKAIEDHGFDVERLHMRSWSKEKMVRINPDLSQGSFKGEHLLGYETSRHSVIYGNVGTELIREDVDITLDYEETVPRSDNRERHRNN